MAAEAPVPPGGLFMHLGDAVRLLDADEEIMDLYIGMAEHQGGLGYLDGRAPELSLTLEIEPPEDGALSPASPTSPVPEYASKRRGRRRAERVRRAEPVTLDVVVTQDPGALRARSGETGSVLWRSSLYLARHVLTQALFAPPEPLLSMPVLSRARVLELGAGTGVLASLIAPLCGAYTATDRRDNLRLVSRNIENNAVAARTAARKAGYDGQHEAAVSELDWEDVSAARQRAQGDAARALRPDTPGADADLVLAVDCIYNEHLVRPLVDTLAAACAHGAVAWVVVEKRSPDVLTHFLETWLSDPAGFTVVRLGDDAMGRWDGIKGCWVGWLGWL